MREFILGSNVSADLLMLLSPLSSQSSFILDTEEHQEGRLTGNIRLRYLVVPSFTTPEGLSGGAVVTSYARRNHPLHRPNVMATTRTGRYIRDNVSGEWLIITRNESDNVTRLQWLYSSKATTRERICLTCNTALFNKGMFVESILFECHDEEWRPCPHCHAPPDACCECSSSHSALVLPKHPLDLPAVAAAALGEPKSEWFGRVQVSVLSNLSRDLRGDVDACMKLRTSFEASQDAALAAQMKNLALAERAKGVIPRPVAPPAPPKLITNGITTPNGFGDQSIAFSAGLDHQQHLSTSTDSAHQLDILSRAKIFPLEAVEPEMPTQEEKAFPLDDQNHVVPAMVMNINGDATTNEHASTSGTVFDPMAMLISKQMPGNGANISNDGLRVVPSSVLNAHPQHSEQLGGSNQIVLDSMANGTFPTNGAGNGVNRLRPDQNTASSSSRSSREDDDDDSNPLDTERLRMPATKAFDAFLNNFMTPPVADHSAPVDVASLEGMDIGQQNGWLNPEIQTNPITKDNTESNAHDPPSNRVPHVPHPPPCPQPTLSNGTGPPPAPAPMIHVFPGPIPNGVRHVQSAPPPATSQKSTSPVTPVTVMVKNPLGANGHGNQQILLNGGQNYPHPQNASVPIPASGHTLRDKGTPEVDPNSAAPLVRLEPRPPGMAAGGDAAWMWHMGPRGPFGMAAIAAARERERRAEERRRKNREAAARSNARAKERILAIKGELEKNKDRISRLTKRRRELELLNSSLKRQLPPSLCIGPKDKVVRTSSTD